MGPLIVGEARNSLPLDACFPAVVVVAVAASLSDWPCGDSPAWDIFNFRAEAPSYRSLALLRVTHSPDFALNWVRRHPKA